MHSQYSEFKKGLKKTNFCNEESVFKEQTELLESGVGIIEKQLLTLKLKINSTKKDSSKNFETREVLLFKSDSLEYFYQLIKFLLNKVKTDNRSNLRFYFPNIRTLIDIYAKILYLYKKNEEDQSRAVACQYLKTLKELNDIKTFYKVLGRYENIFENCGYKISGFESFPKKNIKRELVDNFCFPGVKQIIKSTDFKNILPDLNEDTIKFSFIKMHSACCEYAHGSSILKNIFGNEDLWVIISIRSLIAGIIKLFDGCDEEIIEWNKNLVSKNSNFLKIYDKRK